jgi:CarD family transcriptional regulator
VLLALWSFFARLMPGFDSRCKEANRMTKTKKSEFSPDDFVVYPAHGVGKIMSIEEQEIAGLKLELFVISFEKDKMTLRVPTHKATEVGMRSLSSPDIVTKALETLKGKAKVKRAMWSRRAQEYEQKINSGDLLAIAEVVRDLHRSDDQREQSYSERQLYEAALERLTREVAAVSGTDETHAAQTVGDVLIGRAAA